MDSAGFLIVRMRNAKLTKNWSSLIEVTESFPLKKSFLISDAQFAMHQGLWKYETQDLSTASGQCVESCSETKNQKSTPMEKPTTASFILSRNVITRIHG